MAEWTRDVPPDPDEILWPDPLHPDPDLRISDDELLAVLQHYSPGSAPMMVGTATVSKSGEREIRVRRQPGAIEAISQFPWLRLNGPKFAAFITVECDEPMMAGLLEEFPIPPNLLSVRVCGDIGRYHATWLLRQPVRKDEPRQSGFFRRVVDTMRTVLHCDPGYTDCLMRNPFHRGPDYYTRYLHTAKVTLTQLAEACEEAGVPVPGPGRHGTKASGSPAPVPATDRQPPRHEHPVAVIEGIEWLTHPTPGQVKRNSSLFRAAIRRFMDQAAAGRTVQETAVAQSLLKDNAALKAVDSRGPLSLVEVYGIARSVTRRCSSEQWIERHRRFAAGSIGASYTDEERRRGGLTRSAQPSAAEVRLRGLTRGRQTQSAEAELTAARIRAMAEDGATRAEISARVCRSESSVRARLREASISSPTSKQVARNTLIADAVMCRAQGMTLQQIADRTGKCVSTIHRWLTRAAAEDDQLGHDDTGTCQSEVRSQNPRAPRKPHGSLHTPNAGRPPGIPTHRAKNGKRVISVNEASCSSAFSGSPIGRKAPLRSTATRSGPPSEALDSRSMTPAARQTKEIPMSERTGYLPIPRAAQEIGVSKPTLYRWISINVARVVHTPGGQMIISEDEVDRLKQLVIQRVD
ncbi:helix-turn-helix domain-containing protein [Naumannella halotolerans]|nr:helix-turn-helix domain-containing protein [Naumannella halotolerans]